MLDGAARISDVVATAAADGQPAVGITDHGNMYGVLDFYRAARDAGLTPVHRHRGLHGHHEPVRPAAARRARHLPPHAARRVHRGVPQPHQGRRRTRTSTATTTSRASTSSCSSNTRRVSSPPRVVSAARCRSACSPTTTPARASSSTASSRSSGATRSSSSCRTTGCRSRHASTRSCIRFARDLRAPLLATNDSHYTHRHDAESHAALLCVQTGSTLDDPKRFKFDADEFYLKTAAEMRSLFSDYEEACDNTLLDRRARQRRDRVRQHDPAVVRDPQGHDENSYLRELTLRRREGAVRRRRRRPRSSSGSSTSSASSSRWGSPPTSSWCGTSYRYARTRGIRVGPGRGSAAGSCVAYCLRITDIDPIKYDLLFERMLNPGRKTMPDIDMDFDSRYRGEMIRYASERYGSDHVAQVVTFSTIKARAAVRDSARVLGYPYAVGDKIAKLMPPLVMGRDTPLRACLEEVEGYGDGYKMASELRVLYEADPDAKRVIDVARGLEGLRRQDGIHAAAVVITREPLTEYLPIQRKPEAGSRDRGLARSSRSTRCTACEDLGLLKMDFLGLRNLDVIEIALDLVERVHRGPPRHRPRRPRRPQDVRAAPAGRHHRRVPARRRADAHAAPLTPPHVVRGRRRAGRALPAGSDGHEHAQRLRRPQERSEAGHLLPPRPRGGARAHVRADGLPRAADAGRATARRLLARRGRPTSGTRRPRRSATSCGSRARSSSPDASRRGTPSSSPRRCSPSSSRSPTTRSRRPTPPATASSRTKPRT